MKVPDRLRLDELNQEIVAILQAAPATSNKEIADRLGVSEVTVATRIRNMEENNDLRVMMQRDVVSLGYPVLALIDINVEGRRPEDVANDLAGIAECVSVSLALSSPDIILHVHARSNADLQSIVDIQIAAVDGISSYEILMALEVVKLDKRFGALDAS